MKQMAYIWPSLVENKNAIRLQPFRLHFGIDCSFKMRYCTTFYLNWHRNYERSNLELPISLNKKACFQLQPYIIPVPVEIEVYTVPYFKATINTKVEPEWLGCDGIFISY